MRRIPLLLFIIFVISYSINFVIAQDDPDADLLVPLVPPDPDADLLVPLVRPTDDDLLVPLVTATPPRPTRTPDRRIQLPTDGLYYKRSGASMEVTGQCRPTRYDCNGCGGGVPMSEDDLPRVPICGSAEGLIPSVEIEGEPYLYMPPSTNRYGQSEFSYMQEVDANGQTIGSIRIETRTDVIVISPTEVHLVTSIIQEDGCTHTYTIVYTLASAGGVTCTAQNISTPTPTLPTPTPTIETTLVPTETPEKRTVYLIPDDYVDASCNAENTFPSLETVDIRFNDNDTMTLTANQIFTLYRDGDDSYGYESSSTLANSYGLMFSIVTEGEEWSLLWRGTDAARNNCWRNMRLTVDNPLAITPTPTPNNSTQNQSAGGNKASGIYDAEWLTEYMPACEAMFAELIPDNPTIAVTFTNDTITVDFGEGALTLTPEEDWYIYYPPANNGIQLGLMLFEDSNGDGWLLSWSAVAGDKTCVTSAMLTLP